jgi:expansin (peptidoglycan-binding protein)
MSLLKIAPWLFAGLVGCGGDGTSGPGPGPTDPGMMQMPGTQPSIGSTYTGEGTYYGATGGGNCSYDPSPGNLMVAAMNAPQYDNSSVCGMCVEVTGPKGAASKIVVRIVDKCPECKMGDLDLSQEAFAKIAEVSAGRVPISWQPVACSVTGPMSYRFKEGSSEYWMAVQVRNSRLPIKKLELQQGGNFIAMSQQDYNYYVEDSPAPGKGPFTFRITASTDAQVIESGIALKDATVVSGTQQF